MAKTVECPCFPDFSITMALITGVQNATDLLKGVMSGRFEAALLNPSLILDEFQLVVAANQAVGQHKQNTKSTKSLHSEILYCLSPSKSITDSFKNFGLSETDKAVCVVILNDDNGTVLDLILDIAKGSLAELKMLSQTADMDKIKKVYKFTDEEFANSKPLDGIVSRIATKELFTI